MSVLGGLPSECVGGVFLVSVLGGGLSNECVGGVFLVSVLGGLPSECVGGVFLMCMGVGAVPNANIVVHSICVGGKVLTNVKYVW